jgi:sulfur carrier protein
MQLSVNGVDQEVPAGTSVADLLDTLRVGLEGVAVAVNQTVVPRIDHPDHMLAPRDDIEIIQAVGGG